MSLPGECAPDEETDRENRGDQETGVLVEDGAGIGAIKSKYHGERHSPEDLGYLFATEENNGLQECSEARLRCTKRSERP